MKHFRLNISLLATAALSLAFAAGWLASLGLWPHAMLLAICCCGCAWGAALLIARLKHTMSCFVSALEMDDPTVRIQVGDDDPQLRKMSQSMNRIAVLYHRNIMELETRKLYYDRILKIMTHEMRNSITPVIAIADDYCNNPGKYNQGALQEIMNVIRDQSIGIKKFLDAYYNLTHLPQPQKTAINAGDLMQRIHTLAMMEEKRRGVGSVCVFTAPTDLVLHIDADMISQAIINLLRNALDALSGISNPRIDVSISVSDGHPFISVSDNGPGLPQKVRENLFQPFITTKADGSGIGLSISRQIARCHGGDLSVNSSSQGTTAVLTVE